MKHQNPMHEFHVSPDSQKALFRDLQEVGNTFESDPERFLRLSQIIAKQYLPMHPRIMHEEIRNNNGFIVIRNLPLDTTLPQTPENGVRPSGKTSVSEGVLLGMVAALGYNPIAYTQEKNGALVHEIAPVTSKASSVSSNGVVSFDFHTDGSHLGRRLRPHVLALLCLRDTGKTPTKLARLGDVLERMDEDDILELMQNKFIHTPPETFGGMSPIHGPVLYRRDDKIEVAVSTHNVEPKTKRAQAALEAFRRRTEDCHQQVQWSPGDMVIFNNLRCLHARGQITGDRWLQRCYGTELLQTSRKIDLSKRAPSTKAA